MKLYVWNRPYPAVEDGGSIAYAVAETVEEARELARNAPINEFGKGAKPIPLRRITNIDREPDAIHELPYAEIYHWEE